MGLILHEDDDLPLWAIIALVTGIIIFFILGMLGILGKL